MRPEEIFQLIEADRLEVSSLSSTELNASDDAGWTPLIYAACAGKDEIVDALLRAGADPNITDAAALRPVDYAKLYNHAETAHRIKLAL